MHLVLMNLLNLGSESGQYALDSGENYVFGSQVPKSKMILTYSKLCD